MPAKKLRDSRGKGKSQNEMPKAAAYPADCARSESAGVLADLALRMHVR